MCKLYCEALAKQKKLTFLEILVFHSNKKSEAAGTGKERKGSTKQQKKDLKENLAAGTGPKYLLFPYRKNGNRTQDLYLFQLLYNHSFKRRQKI